jgi:hypothetical protein
VSLEVVFLDVNTYPALMACDECGDDVATEADVDYLVRVNRNQGILLLTVTTVLFLLVYRLNSKGILTYRELLDSAADV